MYKGKFSAGASRNHRPDPELDLEKLLAAEKAEAEANAEVAAPEIKAPEKAETPKPDTMPKKKKPGKKIKRHTIVFYSIYLVMIVACVVAVLLLMDPLDDFLNRYEANQPDVQAEKYFNENFKDPDWAALCASSGNDLGGKGRFPKGRWKRSAPSAKSLISKRLGRRCKGIFRRSARDFSSGQGTKPQEYFVYFKALFRRVGGKDPPIRQKSTYRGAPYNNYITSSMSIISQKSLRASTWSP